MAAGGCGIKSSVCGQVWTYNVSSRPAKTPLLLPTKAERIHSAFQMLIQRGGSTVSYFIMLSIIN